MHDIISHLICIFYTFLKLKYLLNSMQVFANGKKHCHSLIEFYVIHLKNQEIKIYHSSTKPSLVLTQSLNFRISSLFLRLSDVCRLLILDSSATNNCLLILYQENRHACDFIFNDQLFVCF